MPFLRFAKDRRGYESTFLVHAQRGGERERETPLLLYWFRTPPHVKVGRGALDEETIRLLEDTHPRVEFDWPRILASRPQLPEAPPDVSGRPPRPRRRTEDRQERPPAPRALPRPSAPLPETRQSAPEARPAPEPVPVPVPPAELAPTVPEVAEPVPAGRKFVRVFDAPPEPPAEESAPLPVSDVSPEPGRLSERSASERALGSEQLVRVRGRYAAVMARIARRIADPGLAERLRAIAERANPDTWVTDDEVTVGMAGLDAVYAELVPHVGRRRRRRRPGRGPSPSGDAQPAVPENSADSGDDDQPDADEPEE